MKNKKALTLAISALLASQIFFPTISVVAAEENQDNNNSQQESSASNSDAALMSMVSSSLGEGGIPIGENIKYLPISSGPQAVVACVSTNTKPEVNSRGLYTCYCNVSGGTCKLSSGMGGVMGAIGAVMGGGGAISVGKGIAVMSVNYTEGGSKTDKFVFETEKEVVVGKNADGSPKKELQKGMAIATITASVYDGTSAVDDNNTDGGIKTATDPDKDKKDEGVDPKDPKNPGTGDPPGTINGSDFIAINSSCEGDSCLTRTNSCVGDDCIKINSTSSGGVTGSNGDPSSQSCVGDNCLTSTNTDLLPSDTNNGTINSSSSDGSDSSGSGSSWGDAINRLLKDDDDSFNIADDDWASLDGWEGEDNLNDYLNGVSDLDAFDSGGTVDDLFGLDDEANGNSDGFEDLSNASLLDLDGDGMPDAIDLDGDGVPDATLLDTDGDGIPDAIDLDGDGKPDGWLIDEDGDGIADGIDFDGDGIIDQYLKGHEPSGDGELAEGDGLNGVDEVFDDLTDEQLLEMLRQQLAGGSSANQLGLGSGGNSSALGLSQFANSLFGNDAQNIRNNTSNDQELFEFARNQLLKMGFTDRDIASGKMYEKNSSWTEPDLAWDFNRITTLLRKKRIKASSTDNRSSDRNSSNRRR